MKKPIIDPHLKTPWRGLDNDFQLGNLDRGSALWYQVATLVRIRLETQLNTVHEIGPGRGVTRILLQHIGFTYSTLADLPSQARNEKPLLQSATERQVADIVFAYQMLEHNALSSFGKLLGIMAQLSRRFVVVSLPVANPYIRLEIEPKLWSGYAISSRTRIGWTLFFPRQLFPRPKNRFVRWFTRSTVLASPVDSEGNIVEASGPHLWEVGERGAKLRQLAAMATEQNLQLSRISFAPFFPKQVFLEFEKVDNQRESPSNTVTNAEA